MSDDADTGDLGDAGDLGPRGRGKDRAFRGDRDPRDARAGRDLRDGGGSRWVMWLVLVGAIFVGGGVFYHLSAANAGKWFLEVRGGQVVVRKGIWFPTGASDYDGGRAYAPIPLPPGMAAPPRVHDSRTSVDRAIYVVLMTSAAAAIESGDARRLESAKGILSRVRLLEGISEDQADEVLRYRGDIAMAEGHLAIREVATLLARARERVASAATRGTRIYKDAAGWHRWLDAKLAEFQSLNDAREPPVSLCPVLAPVAPAPLAPSSPELPAPGIRPPGDPAAGIAADAAPPTFPTPPLPEPPADEPEATDAQEEERQDL